MSGWPRAEYANDFLQVVYYNASLFFPVPEAPTSKVIGRVQINDLAIGDLYEVVYGPVGLSGPIRAVVTVGFFIRPNLSAFPTLLGRNHNFSVKNTADANMPADVSMCQTLFIATSTSLIFEARTACTKAPGQVGDITMNVSQSMFGVRPVATANNFIVRTELPVGG